MLLLIRFLLKIRLDFIYVNITYVYVTESALAEPTSFQGWKFKRN